MPVAPQNDDLRLTAAARLIGRSAGWLRLRIDRGLVQAQQRGRLWYISRASLEQLAHEDLRRQRAERQDGPANTNRQWDVICQRAEVARLVRLALVRQRFPDLSRVQPGEIRDYVLHELMGE